MNPESVIQDAIRVALGTEPGVVLWRNNCGTAEHWTPKGVQRVRYGLAPGSADLVGLVGGRFVALEVKAPKGRVTEEQREWLALVRRFGGFAAVVHSVDEARAAVARARTGAVE
jgi:hypothetical protein